MVFSVVLAGMMAMAVSTGIGRFAYTPLLPLMQAEYGFGPEVAGWIASANYLGYLLGALWAGRFHGDESRRRMLGIALVVNVVAVMGMPLGASLPAWLALRFVQGVAGALIFVLASAVVVPWLMDRGKGRLAGWHFAGVGVGIVLSGATVGLLGDVVGSRGGWLVLGLMSAVLAGGVWRVLVPLHTATAATPAAGGTPHVLPAPLPYPFAFLAAAYIGDGLGYIITATFLVAMVKTVVPALGDLSWVVVGAAAIPSTVLWSMLAMRRGFVVSLVMAHLLQAVGIALPVLVGGPAAILVGALLFGATFPGVAGVSLMFARAIAPARVARTMAMLTAGFGVGQMLGPALAGWAAERSGYALPLLAAAAVVLICALILAAGAVRQRRRPSSRATPAVPTPLP